ncbi:hypothetical protein GCM10010228_08610 [Streptomyces massasporeus]|nr:hypothetical protein GCM10010228_08610 [Streptomyces massasporeus]
MGPCDQDLSCSDRPDAEQVEELWSGRSDQREDLPLKILGFGLQGLDALGGGSKRPCCHPVLKVPGRAIPELSTVGDVGRTLEFPQLGAEGVIVNSCGCRRVT